MRPTSRPSTQSRSIDTTDELKFYDPETGKPLYRVPEGATIPAHTPHGNIDSLGWRWRSEGLTVDIVQRDYPLRFTREPIAPPTPPLPTEPGAYLDKDGIAVELTDFGDWYVIGSSKRIWGVESRAPFAPASLVPTETWDRLRVLDPEDKRDRIGAGNTRWRWVEGAWRHVCDIDCRLASSSLEGISDWYGPLRFADEVSDR